MKNPPPGLILNFRRLDHFIIGVSFGLTYHNGMPSLVETHLLGSTCEGHFNLGMCTFIGNQLGDTHIHL